MPPDSGGILRGYPLLRGAICPNVVSRVKKRLENSASVLFFGAGFFFEAMFLSMEAPVRLTMERKYLIPEWSTISVSANRNEGLQLCGGIETVAPIAVRNVALKLGGCFSFFFITLQPGVE